MIEDREYRARRERLLSLLEEESALLLFAGEARKSSADDTYPFEPNRNFLYLTGIRQEGSALFLVKEGGEGKEYLFLPPADKTKEKWYGRRLSPEEGARISGILNVMSTTTLQAFVEGTLDPSMEEFGDVDTLYLDLEPELKIAPMTSTRELSAGLKGKFPRLSIVDCQSLLTALRLRKSGAEADELRKAIDITNRGILRVASLIRPGRKEWELADAFLHEINDLSGHQGLSFNTIMASGRNATILHYPDPLGELKGEDLLLMDLGARFNYYNADISRTFPVSGKFEGVRKELYSIVLEANKMIIRKARPGLTLRELNQMVIDFYGEALVSRGFLSSKEQVSDVYFHSVSHFIGLDTHDPYVPAEEGLSYRDVPLEPGAIISDEPGLYFADLGIGIRIEDDLLITEEGCENLSEGIIKEIPDIERLMASRLQ